MKPREKKPKILHDHTCDECGEPATINIQNCWQKYDINDAGDFEKVDEWEGDTNEFYCDKCYNKKNGRICHACGQLEDEDGRCGCTNKDSN